MSTRPETPPQDIAAALLRVFERIVVINLPDRADRRREMDRELALLGLSLDHPAVELFRAVRPESAGEFPSIGAHGAFRSHLGVMERMLDQGWSRILVLEDDVSFSRNGAARMPALLAGLEAQSWAMVYGHPGDETAGLTAIDESGLTRLPADLPLIQLHFTGLTREFVLEAVPMLRAMLTRAEGDPEGGPMHVDGALNWVRAAHPELIVLAALPAIAGQRASRSDITGGHWFDHVPVLSTLANLARRLKP